MLAPATRKGRVVFLGACQCGFTHNGRGCEPAAVSHPHGPILIDKERRHKGRPLPHRRSCRSAAAVAVYYGHAEPGR